MKGLERVTVTDFSDKMLGVKVLLTITLDTFSIIDVIMSYLRRTAISIGGNPKHIGGSMQPREVGSHATPILKTKEACEHCGRAENSCDVILVT